MSTKATGTGITKGDDVVGTQVTAQLAVIGAGPAGIVTALAAAERGVDVVLLESGGPAQTDRTQDLSRAVRVNDEAHAPMEIAVGRQLGGTSTMWGGRCVPYDRVDFAKRTVVGDSRWPVGYDDLTPYFAAACRWSVCGEPEFTAQAAGLTSAALIEGFADTEVLTSSLERWSLPTDFGKVYADRLAQDVRTITDATCVGIETSDGRAAKLRCRTLAGGEFDVVADDFVVAAGGLESTRLLLNSPGTTPGASLGDHSGHLGRWYMAHLEGVISDLVLTPAARPIVYDYERDRDGVFVRRRFTFTEQAQVEHGLPNIAGWTANPELSDASHGSPDLSFTYLALISPLGPLFAPKAQRLSLTGTPIPGAPYGTAHRSSVWQHLRNLVRHPVATLRFAFGFGIKRVLSPGRKPPGFFVPRPDGIYPFQYHAEHLPHRESRVTLDETADEFGMRRLRIDIRFEDEDLHGVVAAHREWDAELRRQGVGYLRMHDGDPVELVRSRSGGGFHQVGTTRMSADPADGVLDADLAVHGVPNLFVVSSSAFVTSGQANSTFMVVAFALRLIDHLYADSRDVAAVGDA